ncbi:MAG TPA: nuclear transport factor 2 family protein [Rhizomicrobium sp.]|nr:nuclear transport factor 2 family protein [Rhizomicrobium sp.]
MTDQEKLALARRFLSVLASPDPDVVKSVAVEDVVWSFPGAGRISGEARGVDGVMARAKIIASFKVNIDVVRTLYSLGGVAIILHNTANREGHVLDEHIAAVFSFRGERVCRLDTYLSDVPMAEAFFV